MDIVVKSGSAHPFEDVSNKGGCRSGVVLIPTEIGLRQSRAGKRDQIDGSQGSGQFGACAGFKDGIGRFGDDEGETAAAWTGLGGKVGVGGEQRVKRPRGDGDGDALGAPLGQTPVESGSVDDLDAGIHLLQL